MERKYLPRARADATSDRADAQNVPDILLHPEYSLLARQLEVAAKKYQNVSINEATVTSNQLVELCVAIVAMSFDTKRSKVEHDAQQIVIQVVNILVTNLPTSEPGVLISKVIKAMQAEIEINMAQVKMRAIAEELSKELIAQFLKSGLSPAVIVQMLTLHPQVVTDVFSPEKIRSKL